MLFFGSKMRCKLAINFTNNKAYIYPLRNRSYLIIRYSYHLWIFFLFIIFLFFLHTWLIYADGWGLWLGDFCVAFTNMV